MVLFFFCSLTRFNFDICIINPYSFPHLLLSIYINVHVHNYNIIPFINHFTYTQAFPLSLSLCLSFFSISLFIFLYTRRLVIKM
ncbi:hypothetical protein J3Q64DRAFT_1351616 [Phycomyces blakesleeanus]|uniref:Uncharacterized protein n=1 Tax=Phycomyces blakesleeanus TaxID=4837 RepID=A0ABR3ALY5_PHYBL